MILIGDTMMHTTNTLTPRMHMHTHTYRVGGIIAWPKGLGVDLASF